MRHRTVVIKLWARTIQKQQSWCMGQLWKRAVLAVTRFMVAVELRSKWKPIWAKTVPLSLTLAAPKDEATLIFECFPSYANCANWPYLLSPLIWCGLHCWIMVPAPCARYRQCEPIADGWITVMPWRRMNSLATKNERVFTKCVETTTNGKDGKRNPLIGVKNG